MRMSARHSLPRILFIGVARPVNAPAQTCFVTFDTLSRASLRSLAPDIIIAPLWGRRFDALDLCARLKRLGFGGAVRIVSPDLPAPRMVMSELRSKARGLDLSLLILGRDLPLRSDLTLV